MTEAEFEDSLIQAAGQLGYYAHAERPARQGTGWVTPIKGQPGWPDVVLVGFGHMFAFELKAERGRMRPGQAEWIERCAEVPGVTAMVVRPSDIDAVLELLLAARKP